MEYCKNETILKDFYLKNGLTSRFNNDNLYLENAFNEINRIWSENLNEIEKVNFVLIAEAPLWGQTKKYIYNPAVNNSQFFYRSDLSDILNIQIANKLEFLKILNKIGFVVVDISPFPLNPKNTAINYRDLSINQYRQLVSMTLPYFFNEKIKEISNKKSENCKVFFRYTRVKNIFEDLIIKTLVDHKMVTTIDELSDISQKGGGINKPMLGKILKSELKYEFKPN